MNLFELLVKIGVDDQASKKIASITQKLGNGLKTAAKVGTEAVAAVGSGIAALGAYSAKVGGDFEAQMSKVSAISGATGDDLQALEDKAKQLGIDTKFSATEAGQAFEYMAMAGWKTEQMLDGVAGIMDLAAASGEDLASVSDIVTDAMTAFGLSAEDSGHFADVLAKASSSANTNVALMGETFKYVAPVAGAMGFNIEDTATAIGLMANAGIKGSQAGTALRAMLSRLAKPTDEVAWAMEQLDLTITNSDGTMRDFDDIIIDLRGGFEELTEAEQTEMAAMLAGQEAMSGLLAIVNTSEEEFNKLSTAIYSADGAAKQMADTMANNLQGKLTLLKSSAEGFGLALYEKIQTPLTNIASWAVDGLNSLTEAFNEGGVDGLVDALGSLLSDAITQIVENTPKIVDLAITIIESFIDGLSENQESIGLAAIQIAESLINGILSVLPEFVRLAFDLIITLAEGISEALPELIPTVISVIKEIVSILTKPENLKPLLNAALEIIIALVEGIGDAIPELVDTIIMIIETIVSLLVMPENIAKIINAAVRIVIALVSGIISSLPMIISSFARIGLAMYNTLFDTDWSETGKNIIDGLLDGLKGAWSRLSGWFSKSWNDLVGGVKDFLGIRSPSRLFKNVIGRNIVLGLRDGLEDYSPLATNAMENLSEGIYDAFDDGYDMEYAVNTASSPFVGDTFTQSLANAMNALVSVEESRKIDVELSVNGSDTEVGRMLLNLINVTAKEVYA